jgi:hypothetical protein
MPVLPFCELHKVLQGFVCSVPSAKFDEREENDFPSLLSKGTNNYLLLGFLSLCNHSCDSRSAHLLQLPK